MLRKRGERLSDGRWHAAPAERNRGPILEVLQRVLPRSGLVLEIASGTGQHIVHFARALPALIWQPSDADPDLRRSVALWIEHEGLSNVRDPLPLDVRELVQRTLDELRANHPGRELSLDATSDGTTTGDPDRLLQLFSNLVANALTHGDPAGAVAVSVVGTIRDIVVEVKNQGVIPPERVATLFEPFRRKPRDSSRSGGLGLGLFISQQIALAHGGDIAIESSAQAGTIVTVHLPRTDPAGT